MMEWFLALLAFILSLLATKKFIGLEEKAGFVGKDVNKKGKIYVANFGGLGAALSIIISLLLAIGFFAFSTPIPLIAGLLSITLVSFVSLLDDLFDIRRRYRVLFPFIAALPIIILKIGHTTVTLPFIGSIDLGFMYYLLAALGFTVASNATNMLAGFNGLEGGMAIITYLTFLVATWNNIFVRTLLLIAIGATLAFLKYNTYPAKCFPGNVLNYTFGAIIAVAAIIGNIERLAVMVMTLYILDFFVKARVRWKTTKWWGVEGKDGKLRPASKKIQHLCQLMLKYKPMTEKQLVYTLWTAHACICLISLIVGGFI